jgi:hypothetical protein
MNGKCTVSSESKVRHCGRRPAGVWLAALVCGALLFAGVPVVQADFELGHEGLTGRHRLVDMYDSPGAVCDIVLPGHDSLGETWLRVNPPIMFAINRTEAVDEQRVGWRATVSALNEDTGVWRVVRHSAMTRTVATDKLASYFNGQGWLAGFPLARATYSVSVEMVWFDPDDPRRIEGRATYAIEHFSIVLRHNGETTHGRTSSVCRSPR